MIFLAHALEPQPNNPVRAQNNNKIITKPAVFLVNEFFLGIVYSCNFAWFLENYYKQIVQFLDWKLQAPNMFFKLPFFRLLTNVDTICNQASRGFHWFCFFTPFDWSRKLTLASRSSIQKQSYNQSHRGHSRFPALSYWVVYSSSEFYM